MDKMGISLGESVGKLQKRYRITREFIHRPKSNPQIIPVIRGAGRVFSTRYENTAVYLKPYILKIFDLSPYPQP